MRVNGAQQTGQSGWLASETEADVVVLSSSRGRSDMGGRRPQGVGAGVVVTEAVGVSADVQDHGPVKEAVEEGGGDGGVSQDLAPGGDRAVGGDNGGGLGVALRDHLEQGRGAFGRQGEVAQFVDHEEGGSGVEAHGGGPPALDRGAVAAGGQVGGGGDVGAVAGLGGLARETDGEVRLADARGSDHQNVGCLLYTSPSP